MVKGLMLIIHLEEINDFASFLDKRIGNEIFFEFIKPTPELNGLKLNSRNTERAKSEVISQIIFFKTLFFMRLILF